MADLLPEDDPIQLCYDIAVSIMDSTITSATKFEAQMKYHIKNAMNAVMRYCGLTSITTDDYLNAIVNLSIVYFNNNKVMINNNTEDKVLSKTQGSRSESYRDTSVKYDSSGIPDFIKSMLPTPKIKVTG